MFFFSLNLYAFVSKEPVKSKLMPFTIELLLRKPAQYNSLLKNIFICTMCKYLHIVKVCVGLCVHIYFS